MKHENNFQWLDLVRGIAAVAVLIGHARALIMTEFKPDAIGALGKLFYFVTGFGHQAVVIFFVLSGFFIIRSIHESNLRSDWSFREYTINRMVRLWVVLFPALIMTYLFDTTGMILFDGAQTYAGKIPFMGDINPSDKLGITTFVGNLFFLQNILVKTYGSNGALWSLANEFWYYALFPLLYFVAAKRYSALTRICLLLLASGIAYLTSGILLYFIIWLAGGLLYVISKRKLVAPWWMIAMAGALFGFVLSGIRLSKFPIIFNDFTLAAATVLFLATLLNREPRTSMVKAVSKFFSEISYSVYVSHLPFVVLLSSFLRDRLAFGIESLLLYSTVVIASLAYCWMMYLLFERNTGNIKRYVKNHI